MKVTAETITDPRPPKGWNTSNGKARWVVVAFWGVETTVKFYRTKGAAIAAYDNATAQGADVVAAPALHIYVAGVKL